MIDFHRFIQNQPGVFLPARVAEWIVRNTDLEQVRKATRGQLDDELAGALAAVHTVAQAWSTRRAYEASVAVRGSAVGTDPVPRTEPAASSEYIDVNTIAGRLGMSTRGVRKALKAGRLPGRQLEGGRWIAAVDDVRRFKASRS